MDLFHRTQQCTDYNMLFFMCFVFLTINLMVKKKLSIYLMDKERRFSEPFIVNAFTNGISPAAMDQSIHIRSSWLNHAQ